MWWGCAGAYAFLFYFDHFIPLNFHGESGGRLSKSVMYVTAHRLKQQKWLGKRKREERSLFVTPEKYNQQNRDKV